MALLVDLENRFGLPRQPFYWRLQEFGQIPNREPDGTRMRTTAIFRAYVSEEAFKAGLGSLDELAVEFVPTWEKDIREEAYEALKNLNTDPVAEAVAQVEASATHLGERIEQANQEVERTASAHKDAVAIAKATKGEGKREATARAAEAEGAARMAVANAQELEQAYVAALVALEKGRLHLEIENRKRDAFANAQDA